MTPLNSTNIPKGVLELNTHMVLTRDYFVCKFLPRMFVGSRILFRSPFTKDQEDICFLLVFEGDATASPIPTAAVSRLI